MKRYQVILILIAIIALAGFLRLYNLDSIPPGLYLDEAMNGNNAAIALEDNDYKLFYPENNGSEGFFINLIARIFSIFGIHIWTLRVISALAGILTVLGLYLLTKELFNSYPVALLSSFLLAVSFWHINFSRIAFGDILIPFFLVWAFYFFFKFHKIKNKKYLHVLTYALLSGAFFGLGFYTSITFGAVIVILIVPVIVVILDFLKKYKKTKKFWKPYIVKFWKYDLWIITIIIVALPVGLYFLDNPTHFISQTEEILIFSQPNPILAFLESTVKTLGMFNIAGDKNWRHNFAGSPQLITLVGILFIIGLIISIKKLWKAENKNKYKYWLLLVWFFVMILPAILVYQATPHALGSIGIIPVCYIFAGLGVWAVFKYLNKLVKEKKMRKALLVIVSIVFILASAWIGIDKYFFDWAKHPYVESAFNKEYVEIGNYLNSLPAYVKKYVIVNKPGESHYRLSISAQTPQFIERIKYNSPRTSYLPWQDLDKVEISYPKTVIIPLENYDAIFKLGDHFSQGQVFLNKPYRIEIK